MDFKQAQQGRIQVGTARREVNPALFSGVRPAIAVLDHHALYKFYDAARLSKADKALLTNGHAAVFPENQYPAEGVFALT